MKCEIRDAKSNLLAVGHREGSLYYLDHNDTVHQACPTSDPGSCKGTIWHRQTRPLRGSKNARIGKKQNGGRDRF